MIMGLIFFKDPKADMMRGCFTSEYMNGKLMCWNYNNMMTKSRIHMNTVPYLDVYSMSRMKEPGKIVHYACIFNESMIFPLKDAQVLDLRVPAPGNLHEFVSWAYGANYTVPPSKKNIHGEESGCFCQGRDVNTLQLIPKKIN